MLFRNASLAAALMLAATSAEASDLTYFTTVTNTDVASYGIGYMRNVGSGTLSVSGLSGSVSSAYLFWMGPTNSTDPTANAAVSFGGSAITGTNIGFSSDNFWGYANSQAYRADVTSIVQGAGNAAYSLSGFTQGSADINGASLIVFYDDGDSSNNRDVVLFNGNDGNFSNSYDADGWNAALSGINYTGGAVNLTLHVSDGQSFSDGAVTFNGTEISSDTDFNGNTVQSGNGDFPSNGALWDIRSYNVTSLMSDGTNAIYANGTSDALGLIVAQFSLPVGAAPEPPASDVPEPASWAMMLGGFGLIGGALRRSRVGKVARA